MRKKYWTEEEKGTLKRLVNLASRDDFIRPGTFIARIKKEFKKRSVFAIENALRRYTDFYKQRSKVLSEKEKLVTEEEALKRTLKAERKLTDVTEELKQLKKKYRLLLREVNLEEAIKREIRKIAAFPPVERVKVAVRAKKRIHESAILLLSDIHFGEKVSREETKGLGNYNISVALDRLQAIQDSVVDIAGRILAEAYAFDELWVFGLGDWVSGYIHADLFRTAEVPIVEQSYYLGHVLSQMFQAFAQVFPKVNVRVLSGNHPRLQEKVYSKEKWVNWDYVTGLFVKTLLRDQENVEVVPVKSFVDFVAVKGHNFALMHGDEIKMSGVMPYYGIARAMYRLQSIEGRKFRELLRVIKKKKRGTDLMAEIIESVRYLADYTVMGHFHEVSSLLSESIIINGSVIGPNEYSLGKSLGGPPMQLFFGVHPEKGKTWQYSLKLESPPKSRFTLPF